MLPTSRLPKPVDTKRFSWLQLSWGTIGTIVILGGVLVTSTDGRAGISAALAAVNDTLVSGASARAVLPDRVLVVTANPKHQLNIVATVSPRGLEPLLARSLQDVKVQLARHRSKVRIVVLDSALPESSSIASVLRSSLPAGRIIVLNASMGSSAIGPFLLAKL